MADEATIKALNINFTTNANDASKAINSLANSLKSLNKTQANENAKAVASAIGEIATAVNSLDLEKITALSNVMTKLGGGASKVKAAAQAIGEINGEISEGTKAPETKAPQIKAIENENKKAETETKKDATLAEKATRSIAKIALYRAVRQTITNIVQAMREGYEYATAWAQVNNKQLYQSIKNINGAVTNLTASAGGILANIAQIVEPLITKVSQGLVEVANYVSWIIAAAGGMDTYTAYTYDATKATDGLKKSMLGIDEINTIGNSAGNGFAYITKAVDDLGGLAGNSTIKTFFKDIKDAFANLSDLFDKLKTSSIWKTISSIVDRVVNVVHTLMPSLIEGANLFIDTILPALDLVLSLINTILGVVFNDSDFSLTKVIEQVIDVVNFLIRTINMVAGAILFAVGWILRTTGLTEETRNIGKAMTTTGESYMATSASYFSKEWKDLIGNNQKRINVIEKEKTGAVVRQETQISTGYLNSVNSKQDLRCLMSTAY